MRLGQPRYTGQRCVFSHANHRQGTVNKGKDMYLTSQAQEPALSQTCPLSPTKPTSRRTVYSSPSSHTVSTVVQCQAVTAVLKYFYAQAYVIGVL